MTMSVSVYVIIGMLDALTAIVLGFKLYRLRLRKYRYEIALLCFLLACSSYVIRIIFESVILDFIFQSIFLFLFNRYILKIKTFYSALLSSVGLVLYVIIQLIVVVIVTATGFDRSIISLSLGWGIQTVQVITDVTGLLLGYILFKFNLGWTFITIPPHDFSIKEKINAGTNKKITITVICSAVSLVAALYILIYFNAVFLILPLILTCFVAIYILSNRKDEEDE